MLLTADSSGETKFWVPPSSWIGKDVFYSTIDMVMDGELIPFNPESKVITMEYGVDDFGRGLMRLLPNLKKSLDS